jgi:hypothetical protein
LTHNGLHQEAAQDAPALAEQRQPARFSAILTPEHRRERKRELTWIGLALLLGSSVSLFEEVPMRTLALTILTVSLVLAAN